MIEMTLALQSPFTKAGLVRPSSHEECQQWKLGPVAITFLVVWLLAWNAKFSSQDTYDIHGGKLGS